MAETYVTLKEAAELENLKYNTFIQKIKRNPDEFSVNRKFRDSGGRDLTMIALSSLSPKAQKAYHERKRIESLGEDDVQDTPDMPWYVNADLESFMADNKKAYLKAVELGNVVREFMQFGGKDKTEYAERFARERLGKGYRTLYRYVEQYQNAENWASVMQKKTGKSYEHFRVLALCRKPTDKGKFPSLLPEAKQCVKNIWFNEDFARNHGTREMLYTKLSEVASVNNWKIPSRQTVNRFIDDMMSDKKMYQAWYLAAYGMRDFRNKMMRKGSRDVKSLQVMEVVMGDEHTFDCWVAYRHENGKVTAIRPTLVAWIDVRSRMILGDMICHHANSDILKQSVLKMLFDEHGGMPQMLYIDNGKDYTAREMTGSHRNDRTMEETKKKMRLPDFDDMDIGFYHSIGIEAVHRALPYEPWSKTQIERYFRTVCSQFTKWFTSYTGTLTGSRTSEKIDKDIPKMLKRGELFTLEEFHAEWHKWLKGYMKKAHGGLKEDEYHSPLAMFENCRERYYKPLPPKQLCTYLMMKAENRHVYNIGVKLNGYEYRSQELDAYIGENVDIRYDPHDMATIYVFKDGVQVCRAYQQELLGMGMNVEQKAIEEHKKAQNRQIREAKQLLEEANIPFEERNAQYVGFSSSVGGIDLMKAPKRHDNVVAFPKDKTFRSGFRAPKGQTDAAHQEETNEFLENKAEDALKKLRAMM